jgi:hypothetical protein
LLLVAVVVAARRVEVVEQEECRQFYPSPYLGRWLSLWVPVVQVEPIF